MANRNEPSIWEEIKDGDYGSLINIFVAILIIVMLGGVVIEVVKAGWNDLNKPKQIEPGKK